MITRLDKAQRWQFSIRTLLLAIGLAAFLLAAAKDCFDAVYRCGEVFDEIRDAAVTNVQRIGRQ